MSALAEVDQAGINKDTVAIIAPYFPNGNDKAFAYPWTDGLPPGEGSTSSALVWRGSTWSAGADNQYPSSSTRTSSFFVLDTLTRYFDDVARFPQMRQIVLVGHSLAGQMVQRYAAIGDQLNTRVPVTYWVGNPNSYTWLAEDRPLTTNDCPEYDVYRKGLTDFAAYPMTYGVDLVASGQDAVLANYNSRQIAYGRALYDHGDIFSTCADYTQGIDRYERTFLFLQRFRPSCPDPQGRNCDTVDLVEGGHDNWQMFASAAGLARIFTDNWAGDGSRAYDFGYPRKLWGDDPYPNPALASISGASNFRTYAGGMTYHGCWADQAPLTATLLPILLYTDAADLTIANCATGCADEGYSIAGVARGTECHCGNAMASDSAFLTVDLMCYYPCPGDTSEMCGGPDRVGIVSNGSPAIQ